jgi:transcriptional regulator with PAS, ATPase and Fis domain
MINPVSESECRLAIFSMFKFIKDRISAIFNSDEFLVMLYDQEGLIHWHSGRPIKGKTVIEGSGFCRKHAQKSLSKRETVLERDACIPLSIRSEKILTETASFHAKSLIILPLMDNYFLYFDTNTIDPISQRDLAVMETLGEILVNIVEKINLNINELKQFSGTSQATNLIRELMYQYAPEQEPILLTGETGVGKSLMAEWLHRYSGQKGPLVIVPVPSIPEPLFESELFGHQKGSFTGAGVEKKGLVEEARDGTLFFDEISEISLHLQAKLLYFIETRKYRRLGETKERECNLRIISASNRNLEQEIKARRFRDDFYFRLNTLPVKIPPLRERKEDIRSITEDNKRLLRGKRLSPAFWEEMYSYNWPGNIRELTHVLKRAGIETKGPVIGRDIRKILYSCDCLKYGLRSEDELEQIWKNIQRGHNFWDEIKKPFLKRDLNRKEVKSIISRGLEEVGGSYKNLIKLFHLNDNDYHRFMRFLHEQKIV